MAIVYEATNIRNGKKYIGQTVRSMEQRRRAHASSARNGSTLRFHKAIRKHGIDSFRFEEKFVGDINAARLKEMELIKQHDTSNFKKGYNSNAGGCGGWLVPKEKYDGWLHFHKNQSKGVQNKNWSGYSDQDLVDMACDFLSSNCYEYVPGFPAIKKGLPDFPNIFKGGYRFNGRGWSECQSRISKQLGIDIDVYYRSPSYIEKMRIQNSQYFWATDGSKNIRLKFGSTIPPTFNKGRTRTKNVKN